MKRGRWWTSLYAQVWLGILAGVFVGHFFPKLGIALKPLGDAFIALIQMMIGPLVFGVLVQGIASMTDMKKLGRVGLKTLVYFFALSAVTLLIGILAAEVAKPGSGLSNAVGFAGAQKAAGYAAHAQEQNFTTWILQIIPNTFVGAFTQVSVLPIVLVSILTGLALARMGEIGKQASSAVDMATKVCFGIVRMVIRLAPIGAFGAMAFTVGEYDLPSLANLAKLAVTFFAASAGFVLIVLAAIAALAGFSVLRFLNYIKAELLIVLGTSSSETVIPDMMRKLQRLGSAPSTVGLVYPMGYSFNNAGANIYLTLAIFFLAQVSHVHFTLAQQLRLFLIAMLASTGGAGVPGGAFVKVAAMLSVVPQIPITSLALLLGVDKLMSECRALTNVVGNGVATLVVSRWEGEVGAAQLRSALRVEPGLEGPPPTVPPPGDETRDRIAVVSQCEQQDAVSRRM